MVKKIVFTKSITVSELFKEANIKIDPTTVKMSHSDNWIEFEFPTEVEEEELKKLENYLKLKGFKRVDQIIR